MQRIKAKERTLVKDRTKELVGTKVSDNGDMVKPEVDIKEKLKEYRQRIILVEQEYWRVIGKIQALEEVIDA